MSNLATKVIKDISTGINGEDYDVGRILLSLFVVAYVVMGFIDFAIIHLSDEYHEFNWIGYGGGLAAALTAFGALLKFKEKTEPKEKVE